ncbi:PIN domain-like protein [Polychaeton citri CBS 116435]|uniref:PIN domain-like protein n=1 Tax=Polychaeton citri CBS 116435 TaxID=1314669 RepID=A0A9P4Q722_9PEZI|nr:PIN domain-like protein [Polychaeton citri CBS 116435]
MGVTSLWQILQPCARPIKLETLNRKRLAVDASIWIYQFLKAVRDKEGNALRNSHVVGFFRRICKLLFFGIKPVFVFDGGAPALKRQIIRQRKQRREGRREDAVRTAGKLLAVQMQRLAEEEEAKRKEEQRVREGGNMVGVEDEVPDEGLVYVDELHMNQQERQQERKFRKKDAYHLPELDLSLHEMGQPSDPRIMSLEELESYARQFDTGEDINVYDFANIDYDGPFFTSLPAADRYNILNAARLRSRLRMGHSKEQLDSMFPDRMAFSKFQIERVTERNELTQRLMHLNGPDEDAAFGSLGSSRVAGEKAREYVLVKNDGVEGGWALGVIGGDEGTNEDKAIEVDRPSSPVKGPESSDDEGFEDVPIEGLNRLPKRRKLDTDGNVGDGIFRRRRALYDSRRSAARRKPARAPAPAPAPAPVPEDDNALFVAEEPQSTGTADRDESGEPYDDEEDEDLNRAIAMSLQYDRSSPPPDPGHDEQDDEEMREVFQQQAVGEDRAIPEGSGRAIASLVNQRALKAAPDRGYEKFSFGVPVPVSREETKEEEPPQDFQAKGSSSQSQSEDEAIDFRAALSESRKAMRKAPEDAGSLQVTPTKLKRPEQTDVAKQHGFSGPLPFKPLDLGSSILGKKKLQERKEEQAGGFIDLAKEKKKEKKGQSLPPWFSAGDIKDDVEKQRRLEAEDRNREKKFREKFKFDNVSGRGNNWFNNREGLGSSDEVIDLDAEEPLEQAKPEVIDVDNDVEGEDVRFGDVAEDIRAQPPSPRSEPEHRQATPPLKKNLPFTIDESDEEEHQSTQESAKQSTGPYPAQEPPQARADEEIEHENQVEGEEIAWSESEDEAEKSEAERSNSDRMKAPSSPGEAAAQLLSEVRPTGGPVQLEASRSPSLEFEEVAIPDEPRRQRLTDSPDSIIFENVDKHTASEYIPDRQDEATADPAFDDFSDVEDEDLLQSLEQEAQEHARFATGFNQKTQAQNMVDYERELKQLRNQQKKDRRDADEVTHIMISECQQLLRLFGLPYVTAPMEAEAQCAELVRLGLVDGIVTDDSDCFLFGGTRIYKNMFNQAKFVECYLTSDLEKEFDLSRQKLIAVAHLLGSDYTEGLPGIGPVNALEIIGEFGGDLKEFKDWWSAVQMNTITKADDANNTFRKKFRKNATKLFLPPAFPDARVELAYIEPEVDSDPQPFQWGVPDLDALRAFLMATIGWTQERTDEVLVPVIRDMNKRGEEGTQSNITAFFDGGVGIGAAGAKGSAPRGEGFAPRKKAEGGSKRMGSALTKMAEKAKNKRKSTRADVVHDASDAVDESGDGATNGEAAVETGVTAGDDDSASKYETSKKSTAKNRSTVAKPKRGGRRKVAFKDT